MPRLSFAAFLATSLAVAAGAPLPSQAAQGVSLHADTAGELADLCAANPREPAADAKINFCHGFAQGAVDTGRRRAQEMKLFCFPSNPPPRPVVLNEFVNWVRASPEHRNQEAVTGLFHFFGERFPCK
jgi:hypothetical protein